MDIKAYKLEDLEFKAADGEGTFTGRVAVYSNIDEGGDICEPGCFRKCLQEGVDTVPLLWQHNPHEPIGVLNLTDSPAALLCKGTFILSVQRAREAYDLVKAKALKGMSFRYRIIRQAPREDGGRRLKELSISEGSLVTFPMNPLAQVTSVKQVDIDAAAAVAVLRGAADSLKEFYTRMAK